LKYDSRGFLDETSLPREVPGSGEAGGLGGLAMEDKLEQFRALFSSVVARLCDDAVDAITAKAEKDGIRRLIRQVHPTAAARREVPSADTKHGAADAAQDTSGTKHDTSGTRRDTSGTHQEFDTPSPAAASPLALLPQIEGQHVGGDSVGQGDGKERSVGLAGAGGSGDTPGGGGVEAGGTGVGGSGMGEAGEGQHLKITLG